MILPTICTGSDVKFHDVPERGKLDVGWLLSQSIYFVDKIYELWLKDDVIEYIKRLYRANDIWDYNQSFINLWSILEDMSATSSNTIKHEDIPNIVSIAI